MIHKMKRIQGESHQFCTFETDRFSSLCFYNKLYMSDGGIKRFTQEHKDEK